MFVHTINTTDLNGKPVSYEAHFQFKTLDIKRLIGDVDKFQARIQKLVDENDSDELMALMVELLLTSYGRVSEDGISFVQNDQIRSAFQDTVFFEQLLMDCLETPAFFIDLLYGAFPQGMRQRIDANPEFQKQLKELHAPVDPQGPQF